jgi:membrane protein
MSAAWHREEGMAQSAGERTDWHGSVRGRHAETPSEVPTRGWRDILLRVTDNISKKSLGLIAAGSAFYSFLAIPSAFTALIALYGLVFDPHTVEQQIGILQGVMPAQALDIIHEQLDTLTSQPRQALGISFGISLAVALWSANSATTSMMTALNIVYEEHEKRNLFWYYATALAMTAATVVFVIVSLALIAVLPVVIDWLPLGDFARTLTAILRWPLLMVLFAIALGVAYRFAPSRNKPKWRWVSWGAFVATLLWIVVSVLFSFYVSHFSSYEKTYGSLAGVVLLLMWLYLSGYAVIIGAELNAELEHQTAEDSTDGREKPMGHRGATMADTVGEER